MKMEDMISGSASLSQRPGAEAQEDCRDYLRTGRCKYGASCKYNHPANVQSGGGIKGPIDPSEPMFPVRPDEPTCQYYMKHGTCKFGQACKFHHPPHTSVNSSLLGGNTVVMSMQRNGEVNNQQIVMNSFASDVGSSAMTLQFLPQRPDEPDCIYFLRNGRCKYGATCRYHHPVTFHQRKQVEVLGTPMRRQPHQGQVQQSHRGNNGSEDVASSPSGQFSRAALSSASFGQQGHHRGSGSVSGGPTHYLIADSSVAVMAVNTSGNSNSYHRLALGSSNDANEVGAEYSVPLGVPIGPSGGIMHQDYTSSSSSIASSYETASSTLEYISSSLGHGQQHLDANNGLWNRPVKSGSGANLQAYGSNDSAPHLRSQMVFGSSARVALVPSGSDSSIASRRHRATSIGSIGSASDNSGAFPESWNNNSSSHAGGMSGGRGWNDHNNASMDQVRFVRGSHMSNRGDRRIPQDTIHAVSSSAGRGQTGDATHRVHQSSDYEDDGLSMMTSALLNMLDTPEEAAMKNYASRNIATSSSLGNMSSSPATPRRSGHLMHPRDHSPLNDRLMSPSMAISGRSMSFANESCPRYYYNSSSDLSLHDNGDDFGGSRGRVSMRPSEGLDHELKEHGRVHQPLQGQGSSSPNWSPTWDGISRASSLEHTTQAMSVLQARADGTNPRHTPSNVGLYLP